MEPSHNKDPHAAALGQRGGLKRAERQSAQERSALASYAARSRWHHAKPEQRENAPRKSRTSANRH